MSDAWNLCRNTFYGRSRNKLECFHLSVAYTIFVRRLRVQSFKWLYSGKLQPCRQNLDLGGRDWLWQTLQLIAIQRKKL